MAELDESRDESGLFCIRYFLLIFVNLKKFLYTLVLITLFGI